jgi:hypothetical protein
MALTAFSIEPAASPPFGVSIPDGQVRLAAVMPEAAFGHFRPLGARPRKSALGRQRRYAPGGQPPAGMEDAREHADTPEGVAKPERRCLPGGLSINERFRSSRPAVSKMYLDLITDSMVYTDIDFGQELH